MKRSRIGYLCLLLAGAAVCQTSQDIYAAIYANKSLSIFVEGARSAGMAESLKENRPLTVFALTDRAFMSLPAEILHQLLAKPTAMHFLLDHYIVHGTPASENSQGLSSVRTLQGGKLRIEAKDGDTFVNGAKFPRGAIRASNGSIYILDSIDLTLANDALHLSDIKVGINSREDPSKTAAFTH